VYHRVLSAADLGLEVIKGPSGRIYGGKVMNNRVLLQNLGQEVIKRGASGRTGKPVGEYWFMAATLAELRVR
jgi:hypothetical protein